MFARCGSTALPSTSPETSRQKERRPPHPPPGAAAAKPPRLERRRGSESPPPSFLRTRHRRIGVLAFRYRLSAPAPRRERERRSHPKRWAPGRSITPLLKNSSKKFPAEGCRGPRCAHSTPLPECEPGDKCRSTRENSQESRNEMAPAASHERMHGALGSPSINQKADLGSPNVHA